MALSSACETLMALSIAPGKLNFSQRMPSSSSTTSIAKCFLKPARCAPLQQACEEADAGIICEPCNGRGWLLCDFCEGQKTNVKGVNNRIYRRCPSCKAIGYTLCSKCKVFKCVTFPNDSDGGELTFLVSQVILKRIAIMIGRGVNRILSNYFSCKLS